MADEKQATPELKKNIIKKSIQPKRQSKEGEVAHFHKKEDENATWEEACLYVKHSIADKKGFRINETRYTGNIVAPQCVVDTLAKMESDRRRNEISIYRGAKHEKLVGSF